MSTLISLLTSVPEKIDLVRKGRLDDPLEEADRIASLMPQGRLFQMAPQLHNYKSKYPHGFMVCTQSLAIKFTLRETHDIFFHAQSSTWLRFIYLIKELFKKRHPHLDSSHFKPQRVPKPPNLAILERYNSGQKLAPHSEYHPGDHDPAVRKDLISANTSIEASHISESALDFLVDNASMLDEIEAVEQACEEALSHFYPFLPPSFIRQTIEAISKIFDKAQKELSLCGSLFVICIPKEQREQGIFYRSHSYGYACKCDPDNNEDAILDALQKGLTPTLTCSNEVIQYRIYTPLLQPDGKRKIYHLTALSKATRHLLKTEIRNVLSPIDPMGRIIPRAPAETPFAIILLHCMERDSCNAYRSETQLLASSAWHILSFLRNPGS